jgi:hypothetical protein
MFAPPFMRLSGSTSWLDKHWFNPSIAHHDRRSSLAVFSRATGRGDLDWTSTRQPAPPAADQQFYVRDSIAAAIVGDEPGANRNKDAVWRFDTLRRSPSAYC